MSWVWGIDVQTTGLGIAFLHLDTDKFETTWAQWVPGLTLDTVRGCVVAHTEHVLDKFQPSTIAVELPIGTFPKPKLLLHTGVVISALEHATSREPWTITTGDWKKRSVGHGNATKAQVRQWADRLGLRFQAEQDEADALGIAWAARQVWRRGLERAA